MEYYFFNNYNYRRYKKTANKIISFLDVFNAEKYYKNRNIQFAIHERPSAVKAQVIAPPMGAVRMLFGSCRSILIYSNCLKEKLLLPLDTENIGKCGHERDKRWLLKGIFLRSHYVRPTINEHTAYRR